jgi:hypothetical protein
VGAPVASPARATTTPSADRATADARISWAFLAVVATAGVQWFGLAAASSLSLKWFHLAVALLTVVVILATDLPRRIEIISHHWGPFWVAFGVYLASILLAHIVNEDPFLPLALFARQVVYAAAGFVLAMAALSLVTPAARRALALASCVTSVVAVVALFVPLMELGLNPVGLLIDGFLGGQPEVVIFGLFRAAFASAGGLADEAVRANLRHGLASALALSVFLTALVRPRVGRNLRLVSDVGTVVAVLLLSITLSRSVILAVLVWLLLVTVRPLFRGRASTLRWALPGLIAASVVLLAVAPPGQIFEERFTADDGSADARAGALGDAIENIDEYLLGANDLEAEASPHNVVFDALLAGGLLGALAALVFFGFFAVAVIRLTISYLVDRPDWHLPVSRAAAVGIGLVPAARFLTAGGGILTLGEWMGAATFMALVASNARAGERYRSRTWRTRG